jgi:hypothetical protein
MQTLLSSTFRGCVTVSPNTRSRNSTKFSISMPGSATSLSTITVSSAHPSLRRHGVSRPSSQPRCHKVQTQQLQCGASHPEATAYAIAEDDLLMRFPSGLLRAASSYPKKHWSTTMTMTPLAKILWYILLEQSVPLLNYRPVRFMK